MMLSLPKILIISLRKVIFLKRDLVPFLLLVISFAIAPSLYAKQADLKAAKQSINSGLGTTRYITRIETENLINANAIAESPDMEPYRAKIVSVKNTYVDGALVQELGILPDRTPFSVEYNPTHPAANKDGIVKRSNVRREVVMANINQTNLQAIALKNIYDTIKTMDNQSIEMLRS